MHNYSFKQMVRVEILIGYLSPEEKGEGPQASLNLSKDYFQASLES